MHFSLRKNKLVADKQLRSSAYLYLNTTGWTAPGSPNWLEWWCTTEENGLPGEQRRAVSIPNCRAHCVDCETLNHTTCIRTNKAEWQAGFLAVCVCVVKCFVRCYLLSHTKRRAQNCWSARLPAYLSPAALSCLPASDPFIIDFFLSL